MKIHEFVWPEERKVMKTYKIPQIDSIEELAQFWDTHDLTDFEDKLEEVTETVFERKTETVIAVDHPGLAF